jgi:hypothetical protein
MPIVENNAKRWNGAENLHEVGVKSAATLQRCILIKEKRDA